MASLPPLPSGASLLPDQDQSADPLEVLRAAGFKWTNGYRTPHDIERLRDEGYTPASNSTHMQGDTVDLTHPGLSPHAQAVKLKQLFADWPGLYVLDEGDHRHMRLPGWGEAPGTPGTRNSGLPPLPSGATLYQRGSLAATPAYVPQAAPPVDEAPAPPTQQAPLSPADIQRLAIGGNGLAPAQDQGRRFVSADSTAPPQAPALGAPPASNVQRSALGTMLMGQPDRFGGLNREDLQPGRATDIASVATSPTFTPEGQMQGPQSAKGYQTEVDPAKVDRINAALARGASVADIMGLASPDKLNVSVKLEDVRRLVRDRDSGRQVRFLPVKGEAPKAPEVQRPGETTRDYIARTQPGGETQLSQTPLLGRTTKDQIENIYEGLGYDDAKVRTDELASLPFSGGFIALDQGVRDLTRGHVAKGATGIALGSLDFFPAGKGAKAGIHVIDSAALHAAATGADGAVDLAQAGLHLRSAIDEGLAQGGSVTLRMGGEERKIVGTNPAGLMMDEEGKAWTPNTILSPRTGESPHVEIKVPPAVGSAQPRPGDLWRTHPADLARLHADALKGDDEKLIQALGHDGAAEFKRLDRAQNSADPRRADAAGREMDAKFGNLTPEQQRLVYGIGETGPSADDIAHVLQAHNDVAPGDDAGWSAYMAAVSARNTKPEDFAAVLRGDGTPQAQADFVRMGKAYENLKAQGVPAAQVPHLMVGALVERAGWRPEQADEVIGSFVRQMEGMGQDAGAVRAPQLPSPADAGLGDPGGAAPRQRDYLDMGDLPPLPPGARLVDEPPLGRTRRMDERLSPDEMAAAARGIHPEDVTPIPGNRVETAEEAARIPTSQQLLPAPDEFDELGRRKIPSSTDLFKFTNRLGPLDLSQRIRQLGGIQDQGGELAAMGVSNAPRKLEFGNDRGLGNLIKPNGSPLDEMTRKLHEEGWFPNEAERPTTETLIDALRQEHVGGERVFHPNDQPEVERFHAAQAERGRIQSAAQEGAPLVEHVGQPAGLDDVRAIDAEIPATAYEDLPKIGGKVANINLDHIETASDIRRLLQNVESKLGGFDAARRGEITHVETRALAREMGMTVDDLLARRQGQALNAEQLLAARQILAKSSDEVMRLAAKATGSQASDEARAAFAEALVRHSAIHEQVSGAIAESGRALSSIRAAARARDVSGRLHRAAVEGLGGKGRLEDIAQGIVDLQNAGVGPGEVTRFAVDSIKPRWKDKLVELWYNSLLSGPQTHVVNILGNAITATSQIPEEAAAAAIGTVRRAVKGLFGKEDDFDRVLFSELGPRTVGLMQGTREGLRGFAKALKTGDVEDLTTKVEGRVHEAISGTKGKIIRTPTRLLSAEDEFFKAVARRMEINAQAVRVARTEGLKGDELRARIADLSANPTDEMVEKSREYARYLTFQQAMGKIGQRISSTTQEHPWLKLFIPFVRTPLNIFKFVAERSPAAVLMGHVRADIKAGGARADRAYARILLGTGLAMTVADLASRGYITGGGPANKGVRDMMVANGWQPYSIKVGDTYYSYQRLDPIATTIDVAADTVDFNSHMTDSQRKEAGALLIASIVRNVGNRTWISGVSDLVNAFDDPQRNLKGLVSRLAGSIAVPGLVSQAARSIDPVQRDTREVPGHSFEMDGGPVGDIYNRYVAPFATGAVARIESRIPFLSRNLPASRDPFGQEIRSEGGVGPDIVSPIWTKQDKGDPITGELIRLDKPVGQPSRKVAGRKLSTDEYSQYQQMSGRYIQDDLKDAFASGDWGEATDSERRDMVDKIKRNARADARADLGIYKTDDDEEPGNGPRAPSLPPLPPGAALVHP